MASSPTEPEAVAGQMVQAMVPSLRSEDVTAAFAVGTREGQLPFSPENALRGALAVAQLRSQPPGTSVDVYEDDDPYSFSTMDCPRVTGAPDLYWNDGGLLAIQTLRPYVQ